ncbi:MAG: hypothetical protein K5663_00950 [Clostridiales bacterium]|nr:hypothetical protein [Clostridiales bacterium]
MKRILSFLLILVLLVSQGYAATKRSTTPTPTPSPTPILRPTQVPTPTPIPIIPSSQYVLQWKNDAQRGMNYMVPTHWENTSTGERYRVYTEPTEDGVSGFRAAFANKKKSKAPDTSKMKSELRDLMKEMDKVYADFAWNGQISREYSLVKFKGYSGFYTYTDDNGEPMKGFAIIATYDRRIYLTNISGPLSRFDDMTSIILKIVESVTRA